MGASYITSFIEWKSEGLKLWFCPHFQQCTQRRPNSDLFQKQWTNKDLNRAVVFVIVTILPSTLLIIHFIFCAFHFRFSSLSIAIYFISSVHNVSMSIDIQVQRLSELSVLILYLHSELNEQWTSNTYNVRHKC